MAKKKCSKMKHRILIFGFLSVFIIFSMTFTIGKYWVEIFDKYQEKKALEEELVLLREKEEELRVDADKLQNPDYIARYAREKYLYSKEGEYILQIPEE